MDCYQCDENGKSSPWKRKHLDDVPEVATRRSKGTLIVLPTVQKYANEEEDRGGRLLGPLYFDLDYSENPAVAREEAIKLVEFFTGELRTYREQDLHIYFSGSLLIGWGSCASYREKHKCEVIAAGIPPRG